MRRERRKATKGGANLPGSPKERSTSPATEITKGGNEEPMKANERTGTAAKVAAAGVAMRGGHLPSLWGARRAFFFAAGVLVCCLVWLLAAVGAEPALAQEGGGGDAIQSTLANVRDYIAGTLLVLGGIGFVVSLGLKAASPINENAQYLANYGMKSSIIAVLAGAIVNPIMQIIQGLAAGG